MDDCGCESTVGQIHRGFVSAVNPLRVQFIGAAEDVPVAYQSTGTDYMIGDECICTEVAPAQWMLTDIVKPQRSGTDVVTGPQPPSFVQVFPVATDGSVLNASWIAPSELGDTNGWQVQVREGSSAGTVVSTRLITDVGTLMAELTALEPGTTYWVGVAGAELDDMDNVDALSAYVGYTISTSSPTTPTAPGTPGIGTLAAEVRFGKSVVRVPWTAPTMGGTVFIYEIERQESATNSFTGADNVHIATRSASVLSLVDDDVIRGVYYRYRVRAVGLGGTSAFSDWATALQVPNPQPSAPTNLTMSLLNTSPANVDVQYWVRVSWTAGAGGGPVDDFEVQRVPLAQGATYTDLTVVPGDTTAYNDHAVTRGVTYQYRVRARGPGGNSAWLEPDDSDDNVVIPADPTAVAPSDPTSVTAELVTRTEGPPVGGETVYLGRVEWGISAGTALATGYEVQRRYTANPNTGDAAWEDIGSTPGEVRQFNDYDIASGVGYAYRVRALNASGESGWVVATGTVTIPAVVAPTTPRSLGLTVRNETFAGASIVYYVDVDWLIGLAGGPVTHYELERSFAVSSPSFSALATPSMSQHNDRDVQRGVNYTYRVRAVGPGGTSAWATTTDTANIPTIPAPSAPTSVAVDEDDRTFSGLTLYFAELTWAAGSGGGPVTGFEIQRSFAVQSPSYEPLTAAPAQARVYEDWAVSRGVNYAYRIRAYGPGGVSAWVNATGSANIPALQLPSMVRNLTGSHDASDQELDGDWDAPDTGAEPIVYDVDINGTSVVEDLEDTEYSTPTPTRGPTPEYGVTPVNEVGIGPRASVDIPVVPTAVRNLAASYDVLNDEIDITWTAPRYGDTPIRYDVFDGTAMVASNRLSTFYTIDDPTPGEHTITVRSENAAGVGPQASVTVTVATEPGEVVNLRVTDQTLDELDIDWAPPTETGGSPITGYSVQYRRDGTTTWLTHTRSGTASSDTITGLRENTTYDIRVAAINAVGTGDYVQIEGTTAARPTASISVSPTSITLGDNATLTWSSTNGETASVVFDPDGDNFEFSTALSGTRSITGPGTAGSFVYRITVTGPGGTAVAEVTLTIREAAPGPVRNLSASASTSEVALDWDAPNTGGSVTSYRVRRRSGLGTWTTLASARTVTNYTDTTIEQDTTYTYEVRAQGPGGNSAVRQTSLTTPADPPNNARNVEATYSPVPSGRVNMTWDAPSGGGPVTGYIVRRGSTELTTTTATSYTDVGPPSGTHYYNVTAYGPGGNAPGFLPPGESVTVP